MKLNLAYDGEGYLIHHFGIQAEIFATTEWPQ